jgi:[ribosomal protein S18]-alanine N-acetyltransferase
VLPRYRRMAADDVDTVVAIEKAIYPHPWTRGNFTDSLTAGYHCWIVEYGGEIAGYTIVAIAAEEAHLLNLSVADAWQRRGVGRALLAFVLKLVRDYSADRIVLEVRPSNVAARALYATVGFAEVGSRRGYYPAAEEREDAVVLALSLKGDS